VSIRVSLDALRDEIGQRSRPAFFLTVSDDGRPHAVAVPVSWSGETLVVEPGNRTAHNAAARPDVSLVWAAEEEGGYSLIVDATVRSSDAPGDGSNRVVVAPTSAVLHRPAAGPSDAGDGCGSDCLPLLPRAAQH